MIYEVEYKHDMDFRPHWLSSGHRRRWTLKGATKLAAALASNLYPPKPFHATKEYRVIKCSTEEVLILVTRVCKDKYKR